MKTLEELRRLDERRLVVRVARLLDRAGGMAVVLGGTMLILAWATMGWHKSTMLLAISTLLCTGGLGTCCASGLLDNSRRRRAAACPMRRASAGERGARGARRIPVPARERPPKAPPTSLVPHRQAARADRYRKELGRKRPMRAIRLVGISGVLGFAFVGALLPGMSRGSIDPSYESVTRACLFAMAACAALAVLPTFLHIGRQMVRRPSKPRAPGRAVHDRQPAAAVGGDRGARRLRDVPGEQSSEERPAREAVRTEQDRRAGGYMRSSVLPGAARAARPKEDPWPGHRPSDKDAPHAIRLVGILGALVSVLIGALVGGMADNSTYLLHSVVSYACFIGLVVSVGVAIFPKAALSIRRVLARGRGN